MAGNRRGVTIELRNADGEVVSAEWDKIKVIADNRSVQLQGSQTCTTCGFRMKNRDEAEDHLYAGHTVIDTPSHGWLRCDECGVAGAYSGDDPYEAMERAFRSRHVRCGSKFSYENSLYIVNP
jgi:hypothetical protein